MRMTGVNTISSRNRGQGGAGAVLGELIRRPRSVFGLTIIGIMVFAAVFARGSCRMTLWSSALTG
jgi:hypothetical protein